MLLVLLSAALETVTLGAQVVRDRGVGTPLIGEVDLGMGWHESADQPASATCIHFRRDTSSAQYGESALRQVTTRHEMERHFAGSAKLSYGGVGTSFSAAIQYARSRDFRSSDMSFSLFGRAYSAEYMAGDTEVALTDDSQRWRGQTFPPS